MASPHSPVNEFLAPYEQRPVTLTSAEIEQQRAMYAFGRHLSRISGAQPSPLGDRLLELVILGKATPRDVMDLGAECARRGYFTRAKHDRWNNDSSHKS
jgi:hypothetical protein